MILLLGFALVAGLATSLSPCALPVLPVAFTAGATGGRRRPLGVVTGLVLSFTFATVALVYVIAALGLPDDLLRDVAIVVLAAFGVSLLIPALSARIEAWLTRLGRAPRGADKTGGFMSGLPLGFSLGLLYAPCAGPILAGVITVSAAQTFTAGRLAVALAYAVGSAAGLYVVMLGGRRLVGRLVSRSARVQQAMGAVMIVVAVLIAAMVDVRLQTAIANDLPSFLLSPAEKLQRGAGHNSRFASAARSAGLPVLGQAPEFRDNQRWFNTPAGAPLTMTGLRGRVVLVDFWTYTCINCIRTFPHLKALDAKYRRDGLTIVGVHSPEFPFERDASNVESAIHQNGLRYPVVQDNKLGTWNAWGNQYWPADYLVDARGRVRFTQFGEGGYAKTERAVRALLQEAGHARLGGETHARIETASAQLQTPETYLGAARANGFVNGQIAPGAQDFGGRLPPLSANSFGYAGRWRVGEDSATAAPGARVGVDFVARRVFLVLGSPDRARRLRVLLDGKPIPGRLAGADVHAGTVTVRAQRLYRLVNLPKAEEHKLTLAPEPGISGYAFTFG